MPSSQDRVPSPARSAIGWFLAGYAGLAAFLAVEATVREGGAAASLAASGDDRDSTRDIAASSVLAACLAPGLRRVPLRPLPRAVAPAGVAVEAAGLAVRVWSMRTLRGSYSRTLRTDAEHPLVEVGPYRHVRHPGYLGSLLVWMGFALTSRSTPVVVALAALLGRAYARRISAEEALLRRDLAGYSGYTRRTKKLIPLVW